MTALFCCVKGLSVRYEQEAALSSIDLDLIEGERLAIIGESGSGKSTFARALAGLLPVQARIEGNIIWPALGHGGLESQTFELEEEGELFCQSRRMGDNRTAVLQQHGPLDIRTQHREWSLELMT